MKTLQKPTRLLMQTTSVHMGVYRTDSQNARTNYTGNIQKPHHELRKPDADVNSCNEKWNVYNHMDETKLLQHFRNDKI